MARSASLRAAIPALRAAFPDFKYEVLQQMQDGDTHVGRFADSKVANTGL